jgi:hypothetical protein
LGLEVVVAVNDVTGGVLWFFDTALNYKSKRRVATPRKPLYWRLRAGWVAAGPGRAACSRAPGLHLRGRPAFDAGIKTLYNQALLCTVRRKDQ